MQRELLIISMLIWDLEGGEQKCHIHVLRVQVLLPQGIEVVLKEKSGVQHGTDTSKGTPMPKSLWYCSEEFSNVEEEGEKHRHSSTPDRND